MDNKYGAINEQGYLGGEGYGFSEATEEETERLQKSEEESNKKKK